MPKNGAVRANKGKRPLKGDLYNAATEEMRSPSPNVEKATAWLWKASKDGDARATYALATWFLFGQEPFIRRDLKTAGQMLREAANAGIPEAMYDLGRSLETGSGIRKSLRQAFEYYLRAAIRGDKHGIWSVGRCYYWGIGIKRDRRLSWIWHRLSEELGALPPDPTSEN